MGGEQVKPPPFLYARPETLNEALELLADVGEEAKVLAGGQSLVPLLNLRLARPAVLIDLNLIDELRSLSSADGDLVVGAGIRQRVAEVSSDVQESCPLLPMALAHVGHLQIRNRGTIAGSIAHADPAAELPACAVALGAKLVAVSKRGERVIDAIDFFEGPFTTALTADELLREIRFPTHAGARFNFLELARRSGDFALAGVAVLIRFETDAPRVADASLTALGVGGTPTPLLGTAAAITGKELIEDTVREAGAAAAAEVHPLTDMHADAEYRRELISVLVSRALKELA